MNSSFFKNSVGSRNTAYSYVKLLFYTRSAHIPKSEQNAGDLLEASLLENMTQHVRLFKIDK